jgi:hypothetical protein
VRRYERMTVVDLAKRLRQYANYVGCGCYGRTPEQEKSDGCQGQRNCARADYVAMVQEMRIRVRPDSTPPDIAPTSNNQDRKAP